MGDLLLPRPSLILDVLCFGRSDLTGRLLAHIHEQSFICPFSSSLCIISLLPARICRHEQSILSTPLMAAFKVRPFSLVLHRSNVPKLPWQLYSLPISFKRHSSNLGGPPARPTRRRSTSDEFRGKQRRRRTAGRFQRICRAQLANPEPSPSSARCSQPPMHASLKLPTKKLHQRPLRQAFKRVYANPWKRYGRLFEA